MGTRQRKGSSTYGLANSDLSSNLTVIHGVPFATHLFPTDFFRFQLWFLDHLCSQMIGVGLHYAYEQICIDYHAN